MAQEVKTEIIFVGSRVNQYLVKDYIVSENNGDWFCSCSIKYSRNPKLKCKHISLVQAFLLSDEQKDKLRERHELRLMREKVKELDLKACKNHLFIGYKEKGAIFYECKQCESRLTLEQYRFYRKLKNLS